MDKIFDLKFIVPPTLFFCFVFIINPYLFSCLFESLDYALAIFASIILVLGFIISSLTCFILNIIGHPYEKDFKRSEHKLKRILIWDKPNMNRELEEWRKNTKEGDFICNQIQKRWDMAIVNFNSSLALFFSFLVGSYLYLNYSSNLNLFIWIILEILFLWIFLRNGFRAYLGVYDLEKIIQESENKK